MGQQDIGYRPLEFLPGFAMAVLDSVREPGTPDPIPQNSRFNALAAMILWPQTGDGDREHRKKIRELVRMFDKAGRLREGNADSSTGKVTAWTRHMPPEGLVIMLKGEDQVTTIRNAWDTFAKVAGRVAGFSNEAVTDVDDLLADFTVLKGEAAMRAYLIALPAGTIVVGDTGAVKWPIVPEDGPPADT